MRPSWVFSRSIVWIFRIWTQHPCAPVVKRPPEYQCGLRDKRSAHDAQLIAAEMTSHTDFFHAARSFSIASVTGPITSNSSLQSPAAVSLHTRIVVTLERGYQIS